jgi:hypothetical protein
MRDNTLLAERRAAIETSARRLAAEMERAQRLLVSTLDTARRTSALRAAAFAQLARMSEVRADIIRCTERLHRSRRSP